MAEILELFAMIQKNYFVEKREKRWEEERKRAEKKDKKISARNENSKTLILYTYKIT